MATRKTTEKPLVNAAKPPRVPVRKVELDAAHCWLERSNPLHGLSIRTAQSIFDCARSGDTQRLHWLYQEIESANPLLFTCIERRQAAIAGFMPKVAVLPSMEGSLADEQKDAAESFLSGIENFTELLEHLDTAFFRGFALAQPIWEADGTVREVALHNSWEFLVHDGTTYHNPECDGFTRSAVPVTDAGLIGVQRTRAIDNPALAIHIRHAVSERDWGRFLERYALPKPAVTMASNATNESRADYLAAARAVENGQVSVWPFGTVLTDFAGGSRGTDPFNSFIEHQEKLIVLLSTGGTLTSLAQADTGSLAGGAQMKVWQEIVRRDAGVISQSVMRSLVKPYLAGKFGGRPCSVAFSLEAPVERNAQDAAQLAATLKTAGYIIDQGELEKAVGFTLEKAPEAPEPQAFARAKAGAAFKTAPGAFKAAPRDSDGQGDPKAEDALVEALSGLFERALAEAAAEEIEKDADLAAASDQPRGKTSPESTPGSFAPADGGTSKDSSNKPAADKADASGDSGSSGAPAEAANYKPASAAQVQNFKTMLPKDISPEEFDSLLTAGFDDVDGAGNTVRYGTLLRDHINNGNRNAEDRGARKRELGSIVRIIRETKPVSTARAGGKERMYAGYIGDKAYVAVADEHNEIGAFLMVSYRRDGKHDKK